MLKPRGFAIDEQNGFIALLHGGVARVWALDIDRLLEIARGRVTRSLTAAECRQYLQGPCP